MELDDSTAPFVSKVSSPPLSWVSSYHIFTPFSHPALSPLYSCLFPILTSAAINHPDFRNMNDALLCAKSVVEWFLLTQFSSALWG
jgi:hypothetical protein